MLDLRIRSRSFDYVRSFDLDRATPSGRDPRPSDHFLDLACPLTSPHIGPHAPAPYLRYEYDRLLHIPTWMGLLHSPPPLRYMPYLDGGVLPATNRCGGGRGRRRRSRRWRRDGSTGLRERAVAAAATAAAGRTTQGELAIGGRMLRRPAGVQPARMAAGNCRTVAVRLAAAATAVAS